jgi:hypothetical protein
LRREARRVRRAIRKHYGLDFLVKVAVARLAGSVLEEKVAAVFLLEKLDADFGTASSNGSIRGATAAAAGPVTMRWFTV